MLRNVKYHNAAALLINAVVNNFAKKKYCFSFKNIDLGTRDFVVSAFKINFQ